MQIIKINYLLKTRTIININKMFNFIDNSIT